MSPTKASRLAALEDRVQLTAALATHFDPLELFGTTSLLEVDRPELVDSLAAVCDEVEVPGSDYRHWAMRPEARQALLRKAANARGRRLLSSISVSPDDRFATYLREGLLGSNLSDELAEATAPTPGAAAELDPLFKAARLLEGLPGVKTTAIELERKVRRQLALADSDQALRAVVPPRLVGRDEEYAELSRYRATELATDGDGVSSFVLVGPGGIGKSALVSTFVTDERERAGAPPLIYLDFDRATLIGASEVDLTLELAHQLSLADQALEPALAEFRIRARSLLDGRESADIDAAASASGALYDLSSVLMTWPHRLAPVTLVLDTFEEVAIRKGAATTVLQWAADVRDKAQLRQVHLIICGRAVVPQSLPGPDREAAEASFNILDRRELTDLSTDMAGELLTELGVEPGLASRFPPIFGGNPLVLKLIRRFVEANEPDEVEALLADGAEAGGDAPAGELALAFVYERILNRIAEKSVQTLAYPGIVLRSVTPELILKVLAPTCGDDLDITTTEDAQRVFDELAGHVWLVDRVAPDVVVHRADLRRLLVPGLEYSKEIDAKAIHRVAASYYAGRPASVAPDEAMIEEIYHRGFLDDLPSDFSHDQAQLVVQLLASDLEFWPPRTRATVMATAGQHDVLTNDDVVLLDAPLQRVTREARMGKSISGAHLDIADYEATQLDQLGTESGGPDTPSSIAPLMFDRGEFYDMTDDDRVRPAFEHYFADPSVSRSSSPTHEYPWYIAVACLFAERGPRQLFSDQTLATLESSGEDARRYGVALAALAGDPRAYDKVGSAIRRDLRPRVDLPRLDDIVICQAAYSGGDLDDVPATFQTFSGDHFRLSHIAAVATSAHEEGVTALVTQATADFTAERPDIQRLNSLRQKLSGAYLVLGGLREVRAAPTTLSFLYGAIRTVLGSLDRDSLLGVAQSLEVQSVFWPSELTARSLDTSLRTTITPTDLNTVIETADRCGLLVDLLEIASLKVGAAQSIQLAAGVRRLEELLFPFAPPRAGSPR